MSRLPPVTPWTLSSGRSTSWCRSRPSRERSQVLRPSWKATPLASLVCLCDRFVKRKLSFGRRGADAVRQNGQTAHHRQQGWHHHHQVPAHRKGPARDGHQVRGKPHPRWDHLLEPPHQIFFFFCGLFAKVSFSTLLPTGSPLQFFVDAVNSGVVTAYGPGLSYGMVNRPASFTVVTKNAGEGA